MRPHMALVILIFLGGIAFSTLLAGASSADESSVLSRAENIMAGDMPVHCDLRPLNVRVSPSMITAGNQLSSIDYMVQNHSTTAWSGTVNVKVYIFEQGRSVTSGTLIHNHSFAGKFSAKSSQQIKVQSPVIIPPNIPAGDYKIGIFLDILDLDTTNNSNAFLAARHIWVDAETTAPTIQITTPTSDPTYSTSNPTINIFGTASDNVGITEVRWVNGSTQATGTASGTTSWSVNGIFLKNGNNVISVSARDAAGNKGTATLAVTYRPPDIDSPDTVITAGPAGIITTSSATFTYTGSDNETQTSDLAYATYLQGYDHAWSHFTSSTTITYSNLPDGHYTFQVQARDHTGNIDPSPARKSFTVNATACSHYLSPADSTFGPGGGSGVVNVTVPSRCTWTASSDEESRNWIRISSGSKGSGDGIVNYTVLANNTGKTRTGTLTIAGHAFTVIQLGSKAFCPYTLTVKVNPAGSGTITKDPERDTYCPGDRVTLTANSNSGYDFRSWREVDSSNGTTAHVTMNGNRTLTAFFTANEEIKLPFQWMNEGSHYPFNHLGHSGQVMNHLLRIGDYYPISFLFENSGDVEIEVTGSSRMCIGLYSAENGSLLSYSNGIGDPKTMIKYPVSERMAYHLVVTPCVSKINHWTFSIKGPSSSGNELHLDNEFRGGTHGIINRIHDRKFYSITAPPIPGRRLIATLLPKQNFNGLLRLFDDKGTTLVTSANNLNDGAVDVLTYTRTIPGQTYYICVEGYSAGQHQGTGNYELRVEFVE